MNKRMEHVLDAREKSIGDGRVLQPLPHKDFRFASPFVVLHHMPPRYYPPGSTSGRLHPHPHRGFAPVTFLFQGEGYHKDSRGNSGVIRAGEVQWMFAGSGLLHSEGPTKAFLEKGGTYELIQLWVNVPARNKMDEPTYQQATVAEMPSLFPDDGIQLQLASGQYEDLSGPIQSFTPVTSVFGTIASGKNIFLQAPEGYWTLLYLLEGTVHVTNEKEVTAHQLVVFGKEGSGISFTTKSETKLLFLSAEPINEPVAAKGNFVMNSADEIVQAENDYAAGMFGNLDD